MAEYFYGKISIPKVFLVGKVIELVEEEFGNRNRWQVQSDEENGILTFTHESARNGCFEDLEDELAKRDIPFDRYSAEYDEYPAETRYFRPATADGTERFDNTVQEVNDNPFVLTCDLKLLFEMEPADALIKLQEMVEAADPEVTPLTFWSESRTAHLVRPDEFFLGGTFGAALITECPECGGLTRSASTLKECPVCGHSIEESDIIGVTEPGELG